jgi:predicted permease
LANRDVICAAVLLALSVGAWMQAAELPSRAALFPRLDIALLFGFSVIYLLRSLWRAPASERTGPFFRNATRFVVALLLIVAYVLIFPRIGFFTATALFIPVFAVAIGSRSIANLVLGSAIFTVGAWVVFVVLLGRRLPPEKLLQALTGALS